MPENGIFCNDQEVHRYQKILDKLGKNYPKKFAWKIRTDKAFRERFAARLLRIIPQIEIREEYPEFTRGNPLLIERRLLYYRFIGQDLESGEFFPLDRIMSIAERIARTTLAKRKEFFQENSA